MSAVREAFSDVRYEILQQYQDGEHHIGHIRASGTMSGDFMGMPPSNKSASWDELLEDTAARFSWDNGRPASAADIRPGTRIEATGVMCVPGALLARQIILYSGQPETGIG